MLLKLKEMLESPNTLKVEGGAQAVEHSRGERGLMPHIKFSRCGRPCGLRLVVGGYYHVT